VAVGDVFPVDVLWGRSIPDRPFLRLDQTRKGGHGRRAENKIYSLRLHVLVAKNGVFSRP
jgi:hypothetical protein